MGRKRDNMRNRWGICLGEMSIKWRIEDPMEQLCPGLVRSDKRNYLVSVLSAEIYCWFGLGRFWRNRSK